MNTDTWYYKAGLKVAVKDYDDAIRCYDEALEINPKFAEAGTLFKKKDKQKAIDRSVSKIGAFQVELDI